MSRRRHQSPELRRSITKNGKKDRWWFRAYTDVRSGPGQIKRVEKTFHLGYCADMGKREAQAAMAAEVAKLNRPAEIIQSQVLFGEVLDKWLLMSDVRASSLEGYQSTVDVHLRPRWGEVKMADMTPLAIEEWIKAKARTQSQGSTTLIRARFSQVWKCALRWQFTQVANPMSLIPAPKNYGNPPREKTLPTVQQFHQFLSLLTPLHRGIVLFATATGARIGEILALRWRQFGGPYVLIEESMSQAGVIGPVKTKKSKRTVPVDCVFMERPAAAAPDDFVFPATYSMVKFSMQTNGKKLGIYYKGFGAHSFRRMHNTLFRRASGTSEQRVDLSQQQLGHTDKSTNDLYYIEDETDLKDRAGIVKKMMTRVMGDAAGLVQ